ncbi:PstS ABC-type phosphate transport system, periplasmic component [Candidatus Nanopelagicaceae bacterium]
MKSSRIAKIATVALAFGLVLSATPAQAADLQGSGASFPALLIEGCKAGFAKDTTHTFTYASSSSGTGQSNSDKSIGDFWMSDGAYTAATKRASLIHVPLVAAPIALLHNLPGSKPLNLSAKTVAGIFGGTITKWNDPAIVADNNRSYERVTYKLDRNGNPVKDAKGNPVVLKSRTMNSIYTLPNQTIKVVYRSDSSGTTENFTNYLAKSAPSVWTKAKNKVFKDSFPGNINDMSNLGRVVGAASSTGVSQLAGKTPYSITYAEVNYATANKLKIANLINPAGASVAPDSTGVGAFLASASQDANGYLTYDYATTEKGAYPLGIVSYLLADTKYPDAAKAKAVKEFANYILGTKCSKDVGGALGFSVIDGELLKKSLAQVAKIG